MSKKFPDHPLGATMSTGFKNVFCINKNADLNNKRYAASKASSVMGGLITGMHTRNGFYAYDGVNKIASLDDEYRNSDNEAGQEQKVTLNSQRDEDAEGDDEEVETYDYLSSFHT